METRLLPLCRAACECSRGPSPGPTSVGQQKAYATRQHIFGFDDFRTGQLEAILPALHGKDVFVQMATGVENHFVCSLFYLPTQMVQLG